MILEDHWPSKLLGVLKASPRFGALSDVVLRDLVDRLVRTPVAGGTQIFCEGEIADSMIVVASGRLRVWRRGAGGEIMAYNEVGPGESVGEIGLILGHARTANVTALRDSFLAVLSRTAFEDLLSKHPTDINRVFSQAIYDSLRHVPEMSERRSARSFAVVPLHGGAIGEIVAANLAEAFGAFGKANRQRFSGDGSGTDSAACLNQGIGHLDDLERRFDFLVHEAESIVSARTLNAVRQSDQVIFVASSDADPTPTEIERVLADLPGYSLKRKHLVVLYPAQGKCPGPSSHWSANRDVERVYPLRTDNRADFSRLARFLTDSAVGIVLGGGGARGFAHLGVLRALEEAGVPIDLVGGNSMGALIGAQYASGVALDEILERTRDLALGGEYPTLPAVSLLSGRRFARDIKRMFGNTAIDALWRPFFAAACNLSQACTTAQDTGCLWQAVLASNSPAGLLPPVVYGGDLLVDGAILDNLPVHAMRARLGTRLERRRGNGAIIAVDVAVRDNLTVDPGVERLSVWGAVRGFVMAEAPRQPGIGDILYRVGHIAGLHKRADIVAMADFYLQPPVAGFALMGYRQAEEIADVGYRYAVGEIERWNWTKCVPR